MSDGEWRLPDDPRSFQIAALLALLVYGILALDFDVAPARAGLILATALAAQWAFGRLTGLPVYDPRSALISGLSLCLLLRTGSDLLAATAAVLAVASKFVLRVRGKHVFNPTNAAIATVVLTTGRGLGLAGAVGRLGLPGLPRRVRRGASWPGGPSGATWPWPSC